MLPFGLGLLPPHRAGRKERFRDGFGAMVAVVLCPSLSLTVVQSQVVLPSLCCSPLTLPYFSFCEVMQRLLALLLNFCLEGNKQEVKAK